MTTSSQDVDGATIGELFDRRASKTPDAPAFRSKRGGSWQTTTWGQAHEQAVEIACGLLALGVKVGDKVAILAKTQCRSVSA